MVRGGEKEQMCKWAATSLSILLVIALFCFICVGIANAGSYTYTLSGGPSPETPLVVDDDLEVKVNGKTVFVDDDGVSTHDGRATWNGTPITFSASPGDVLRIIATNPGGLDIELSPLYLHVNGHSIKLSDGVPKTSSEVYEFFNESFIISIPPEIVITNPKEGEEITWSSEGYPAKGTCSGLEDRFNLYLIVRPLTTDQWWVQSTPTIFSEGTWEAMVYFGTKDLGAGEEYVLYVIITEETLEKGLIEKFPSYAAIAEVSVSRVETPLFSRWYLYGFVSALLLLLLLIIVLRKEKKEPKFPKEKIVETETRKEIVIKTEDAGNKSREPKPKIWINEDKPTKTCTIHTDESCFYVKSKEASPFKGVEEQKRDGGWFSFSSGDDARDWCESNYPDFKIKTCKLCNSEFTADAMQQELEKTFTEKEALRVANAFRIIQNIRNNYCNTDTTARGINREFDLLKMYFTESEFLDVIERIQRRINAELREDERLDERHVEEVKNFCEKFTEMWIARFLR